MIDANINWSINISVVRAGNIGGNLGQLPGFTTMLETTYILLIEPGAGINGIGNGVI